MRGINPTLRSLRALPSQTASRQTRLTLKAPCRRHMVSTSPSAAGLEKNTPKLDPVLRHRLEAESQAFFKRRSYYAAVGVLFGMGAIWLTATQIDLPPPTQKMDAAPGDRVRQEATAALSNARKTTIQKLGDEVEENIDVVATGTSKVPTFPRQMKFVDDERTESEGVEYQLVGLGIRTVSFLGIEVYVVGMYVATEDIAELQKGLIKRIDPVATTLVLSEKEKLRNMLLDHEKGEEVWSDILKEGGIRSLIRIVPTRDTDFSHMRDAWVRHLTARARSNPEYADESFGVKVQEFKALFSKGKSVPKGKEMLLARDQRGSIAVWYDDGKSGPVRLGGIGDERVSRGLWLNYLAGKNVASEPARQNIVGGLMEFVQRPIGTVATQVLVDPANL